MHPHGLRAVMELDVGMWNTFTKICLETIYAKVQKCGQLASVPFLGSGVCDVQDS